MLIMGRIHVGKYRRPTGRQVNNREIFDAMPQDHQDFVMALLQTITPPLAGPITVKTITFGGMLWKK